MQLRCAVAVVVLVAAMLDATAAPGPVVLERYEAARPEAAEPIMTVLRNEFEANRAVARPDRVASLLLYPPKPAIVDAKLTSAALTDELELSIKAYIRFDDTALVQLTSALAHAYANQGLVVNDAKAKSAMSRAQAAFALTHERSRNEGSSNHPKAVEAMMTYIRSTREPVVRRMFGPPGEQLYNEVRKTADQSKRGNLVINVNEPDAQIFVNGLSTGRGASFAADQLPGPYCIIVQVGRAMLRYDVAVQAETPIVLEIDWALDSLLDVSDQWVALMLPKGTSEAIYVRGLSRRIGEQPPLIFAGLRREQGYLAVFGYHYDRAAVGHLGWSGETHVTSAHDQAKLRCLAQFLVTGERCPSVVPIGTVERIRGPSLRRPWPGYAAATGAVGALASGGYALYKDYQCNGADDLCKYRYSRAGIVGYSAVGVGVALGAIATYLLFRNDKSSNASKITVAPVRSGALLDWVANF